MKKFFFNRCFDKNRLKHFISWSLIVFGEKHTIKLVEELKDIGFGFATEAGISLSIDDLKIPPTKSLLISEAEIEIFSTEYDYLCGNLTAVERFQKMIDIWHRTSENLKQNVVQYFRSTDVLNPVYMMAFSGARGNISQVRQLVGMRGLMADPQGQIIDFPIRSNFREGLTLTEYIISCYGARKGLVDTALRTANSGYLTRRLVDVAQHILICQLDCGTKRGIYLNTMKEGNKILLSLQNRLIGRILAEDITITKDEILFKNQDISSFLSSKIIKVKKEVFVRSPLTCEAKNSICQLCYGWSLAHGSLVSLGEAVGVLAAQSIGEPGTQLTMRTFHTGGVFSGDMMDEIRAPFQGIVEFKEPFQGILIRTSHGKISFLTKTAGELLVKPFSFTTEKKLETQKTLKGTSISDFESIKTFFLPVSSILFVRNGEKVLKRQLLVEYSSISTQKNQRIQSKHDLNSNFEGQIYFENVLLSIKSTKEGDSIRTAKNLGSIWILSGKIYQSLILSNFFPKVGDLVSKHSIMDQFVVVSPMNGVLETTQKGIRKSSSTLSSMENLISKNTQKKLEKNKGNLKKPIVLTREKQLYENKKNSLLLKKLFFHFTIKKINYKNFGYFFSNYPNSSDFGLRQNFNTLFFCNSILNPTKPFDEIYFSKIHSFLKNYKTNFGGFFKMNTYYIHEESHFGQIFYISEENYESKNFYFFSPKSLKKTIFYTKQKKLSYKKMYSTNGKNFDRNQKNSSQFKNLKTINFLKKHTVVNFSSSCRAKDKNLKNLLKIENKNWIQKKQLFFFNLKNEGKKSLFTVPFDGLVELNFFQKQPLSSFCKSKGFYSQNSFISLKYRSLKFFRNSLANSRLQVYSYRSSHICFLVKTSKKNKSQKNLKKNKINTRSICFSSKFKIKPGWIYFPQFDNYNLKNNTVLLFPGKHIIDDIFFDSSIVCIEYFPSFKNFCNKKIVRIHAKKKYTNWVIVGKILLDKNFKGITFKPFQSPQIAKYSTKNFLYTFDSDVSSTTNKNNRNSPIFYFFYKKNKSSTSRGFNKKNLYYQKFFLLIRKVSEYSLLNLKKFKKDFYTKNTKNNELISSTSQKVLSNQQKIVSLYEKHVSADFKIQYFYTFKNLKKNFSVKKITIFDVFISLQIPKNLYVKIPRLKFAQNQMEKNNFLKQKPFPFTIGIEFALLRRIEIPDSMNFKKCNTKIFTYKKNTIVKKNKVISTSFFSPFDGEIIKTHVDSLGKKNCLLLTTHDQTTFSISNVSFDIKNFFLKKNVGQFIRANEDLGCMKCFNTSGQIIEMDTNKIVIRRGQPILFSSRGVFHIENNDFIQKGSPLLTLFYQRLKTGDIVQGIPKIEEFFEARQTKEGEILPENLHDKLLDVFQNYKQKFNSQEAARKSIQKIQQILVEGVLRVYQSQGVSISDKHLEIIVRQMTSKVKIIDGGQTGLLRGEFIDLQWIEIVNQGLENQKAEYEPIVLGITKASLETESFISAASFQETTRILSRAAIERKTDFLRGLKENVILGHVIPAGTGFSLSFDPENIKYLKKNSIEESFSDIFY